MCPISWFVFIAAAWHWLMGFNVIRNLHSYILLFICRPQHCTTWSKTMDSLGEMIIISPTNMHNFTLAQVKLHWYIIIIINVSKFVKLFVSPSSLTNLTAITETQAFLPSHKKQNQWIKHNNPIIGANLKTQVLSQPGQNLPRVCQKVKSYLRHRSPTEYTL